MGSFRAKVCGFSHSYARTHTHTNTRTHPAEGRRVADSLMDSFVIATENEKSCHSCSVLKSGAIPAPDCDASSLLFTLPQSLSFFCCALRRIVRKGGGGRDAFGTFCSSTLPPVTILSLSPDPHRIPTSPASLPSQGSHRMEE